VQQAVIITTKRSTWKTTIALFGNLAPRSNGFRLEINQVLATPPVN
jgi:hypothetical protein